MAKFTYTSSGVDYGLLDAFKQICHRAARSTHDSGSAACLDAMLPEVSDALLVHVEEGIGTKPLIADEMFKLTGICHFRSIGVDLVAAIVNDVVTSGAMPLTVAMHVAAGSSNWFADEHRSIELAEGFAEGGRRAGATWIGGETSVLKDVVVESQVVLSGSAVGVIRPRSNRIVPSIHDRDAIVFVASSGVHANGLTLCRQIVPQLPDGYLTRLDGGRTFGEALLTPGAIYVDLIRHCQIEQIELHNAIHITGHGWRKLMRAGEPFVYRIEVVREIPSDIQLLIDRGLIDPREAFATFNMGAGFALIVKETDVDRVVKIARQCNHIAWRAGAVVKNGSEKSVEIVPLGIRYEADSLRLR